MLVFACIPGGQVRPPVSMSMGVSVGGPSPSLSCSPTYPHSLSLSVDVSVHLSATLSSSRFCPGLQSLKASLLPTLCLLLRHGWRKAEGYLLKPDPKQPRPHSAPQLLQDLPAQADQPRCPRSQVPHSRERGVSAESSSAVREGAACPDLGACVGVEKLNVSVTTGDI